MTRSETPAISVAATMVIVSAVQFLTPFLASAVGVALPAIGRALGATTIELSLIQTVYILAVAIFLLPCGRLADIHGRKKMFVAGTVCITVTTLALSLCHSIAVFLVFRFLQGIGAAMITTTSFAILTAVVPAERRGRAMGIITACIYVGLAAGPTLAGVVVTQLGWRWVFGTIVPVQAAALALTLWRLHGEWAVCRGEAFDWIGALIFAAALLLLIIGLTRLGKAADASWVTAAGLVLTILFGLFEAKQAHPLLDIHLLAGNLRFTFSNIATLINYAASFGLIFLFSLFFQDIRGFTAQTAGLLLMTQPVTQAIFSPMAGRMADRFPAEWVATAGMAICALGLFAAAGIGTETGLEMIVGIMVLIGFGFGIFSSPNMTAIMGSVEPRHYSTASSMVATMRSMGMLVSMAIVTVVLTTVMGDHPITGANRMLFVRSMHICLIAFSGMSLAGIFFSLCRSVRIFPSSNEKKLNPDS